MPEQRARTCGAREGCPYGLLLKSSREELNFEANPLENMQPCSPEGTQTAIPQLMCLISKLVIYHFALLLFRMRHLAPFITFIPVALCPQVHIHMDSLEREEQRV